MRRHHRQNPRLSICFFFFKRSTMCMHLRSLDSSRQNTRDIFVSQVADHPVARVTWSVFNSLHHSAGSVSFSLSLFLLQNSLVDFLVQFTVENKTRLKQLKNFPRRNQDVISLIKLLINFMTRESIIR